MTRSEDRMAWPTVEEHPTPDIRELLVNPSTIDPPMTAYGMLRPSTKSALRRERRHGKLALSDLSSR